MQYSHKKIVFYSLSLLIFIFFFSSFSLSALAVPEGNVDVDIRVRTDIKEQGYADVIVFVDTPFPEETEIKKILKDKKKYIRKEQQDIFREMNIEALPEEPLSEYALTSANVDLFLEDRYTYVNAFSGILTEEGYEKLLREPSVIGIYPNEELKLTLDDAVSFVHGDFANTLSLNGNQINGSGIGICVIDTGVDASHNDLQGKIVDQYCYCSQGTGCCPNGLSEDTSADDDNGHGTAVIGTIVSQDPNYKGIAPGAHVMAIKAFSSSGSGTTADVLSGMSKCLEKAAAYNIKIFSFSFGGTTYSDACDSDGLAVAANDLVNMGFFVGAASGNSGDSTKISSPACGSNVTAVGSVYDNSSTVPDTIPSFSNANNILDILAPGVNICTTTIRSRGGASCNSRSNINGIQETTAGNNRYNQYSGTSFSAPFVTGAAALVSQYKEEESNIILDPLTLATYLTLYGQPVLDPRNGLVFPRLDIENTLRSIDAQAPTVTFIPPTPENNTLLGTNQTTIAVLAFDTVNEIVLCTLLFNGTNSTMMLNTTDATGRNASCLLSVPVDGIIPYSVSVRDANGNIATTEERLVRFANHGPFIESYSPINQTSLLFLPDNMTFSLNATDSDGDVLSYSWFLNDIFVSSTPSLLFDSSLFGEGIYHLVSFVSDSFENASIDWNITVMQPQVPSVRSISLEPPVLYRTDIVFCNYTFYDPNDDSENGTIIAWQRNGREEPLLQNTSLANGSFFFVNETLQCYVTPSDGTYQGTTAFSENISVLNDAPALTVSGNTTVNETEPVLLFFTISDRENDSITVSVNDSRFSFETDHYRMNTTILSSDNFTVLLSATDGYDTVFVPVVVTILDALDSDSDGIPDFIDGDDDNDAIADSIDRIFGSPERVITNLDSFGILVNGTDNLNQSFEGLLPVAFTNNNETIATFSFNFSASRLHIFFLNISSENLSDGNIILKNLNISTTKTVFVPDTNTSTTAVCIQDVENPSFETISILCNGTQEYLVSCNGTNSSGYSCTDLGTMLQISGLTHSAVVQKCVDADGDGYGTGCALGSDCDDTSSGVHSGATEIPDNGIDEDCSGADTISPAAPLEEEPEETATTGAGGAGGSGGGDGPSSDSGEGTSDGATDSGVTSAATASESSTATSSETGESDSVSSATSETAPSNTETMSSTPQQKTSFLGITGAAVQDLFTGNWNRTSTLLLSSILVVGLFLSFGTYVFVRFRKKKIKKIQEIGTEAKAAIFDVYEGVKDFFRK